MRPVPDLRVRAGNDAPLRAGRDWVLYWMTAARRARSNFALQHAVARARALGKPLVVLEALRCDYPWASDRLHAFVLQGMAANARAFARRPVAYHPYVEPRPGEGRDLLAALAARACVVVGDDHPCFVFPAMNAAAARRLDCAFELVDGNGLLPMRAGDRPFARAFDFRRFLQKVVLAHLAEPPLEDPLARVELPVLHALPAPARARWPAASALALAADPTFLAGLPIDHAVPPVAGVPGGAEAGRARLRAFVRDGLARYAEERSLPDRAATSRLSPYLHFGHVGAHEAFGAVARHEGFDPGRVRPRATGKATGFWGLSAGAEAFVDQLVTWRELGFNCCLHRTDYDRFESLPAWAQATLAAHAHDPRPHVYDLDEFERARTHDPLWNAAQTELRTTGSIHNALRMLWGKKVLEWTASPRAAFAVLVALNDRWALDGRDPNSYSGISWCLGRFDRPWAPERPVYGRVRYMSSAAALRKLRPRHYLAEYGEATG